MDLNIKSIYIPNVANLIKALVILNTTKHVNKGQPREQLKLPLRGDDLYRGLNNFNEEQIGIEFYWPLETGGHYIEIALKAGFTVPGTYYHINTHMFKDLQSKTITANLTISSLTWFVQVRQS